MKKLVLLFTVLIASISYSNAQEKGQFILGGSLLISTSSLDFSQSGETIYEEKSNAIRISPTVGLMVSDKTAVGLSLAYEKSNIEEGRDQSFESKNLAIFGFLRTHQKISERFTSYVEPYFGKEINLEDEDIKLPFQLGSNVGILYFLSPQLSLEATLLSLNYSTLVEKEDDTKLSVNEFTFGFLLDNPVIGLKYYF
ncbi:porin family protein [Sediminitomix flava]|uniref:Outer membrane protein with beta-barrel domain n=1 Tax=Sediminitomix flava TaxID=379075 RepID=A0A315Z822_SEDFL|nr:outer membrane beta-barrel protein [Sediminitomix flava]PWJ39186.1 outer membrane protein with beta-barrel domain [Sediminitomix flava]